MTIEYDAEKAIYDLHVILKEVDMYAELMTEANIAQREGHRTEMYYSKANESKIRMINTMKRIADYLSTVDEVSETQKLLYTKGKKDERR